MIQNTMTTFLLIVLVKQAACCYGHTHVLPSVAIANSLYWLGGQGNIPLNDFLPSYPTGSVELSWHSLHVHICTSNYVEPDITQYFRVKMKNGAGISAPSKILKLTPSQMTRSSKTIPSMGKNRK